jgi:hypothetical protein
VEDEIIPVNIKTLYVVDDSKPFLVALLRTVEEDQPLLIGNQVSCALVIMH